jgi:hypothetical protein
MYKLKNSVIILILITLITVSCNKSSKKDLSLTTKEYEAMGMPDHIKLWSSQAYNRAFTVLSNLKLKDPLSYPRKNSNKSGDVFSRFVNKENLAFVNDSSISLVDRAYEIQAFAGVQNKLIRSYTDDLKPEQYYDEELIDSYIFGLYLHDKMLELAIEIYNSEEQSVINMRSGIRAVLNGYVQMSCVILGEQIKSNVYSNKDLDRLSNEVSRSLTDNLKWIQPADRQKIAVQIQSVIEKSPSDYIKNNYIKTLKVLNDTH